MQKNTVSYVLSVAGLILICACGANKKEEVKVDVTATEQSAEANKEVALATQQPTEGNMTVAQNGETPAEVAPTEAAPAEEAKPAEAATEENKAA